MNNSYNWGDLQAAAADAGFSLVPAGVYAVEVTKAEAGKTSTQKDKLSCRFKITEGPQANSVFFDDFVIVPDNAVAMGFFFRKMNALGLGRDYFAANPPLIQVARDLLGKQASVEVEIDYSYFEDGKNRIKKITSLGSPPLGEASGVSRSTSATPLAGNDIFAAPPPPATDAPAAPPPPPAF